MNETYEPYLRGNRFTKTPQGDYSDIEHVENRPDFLAKKLRFKSSNLPEVKNIDDLRSLVETNLNEVKKYIGNYFPEHYLTYSGAAPGNDPDKLEAYIFMKEITPEGMGTEAQKQYVRDIDEFVGLSGQCFIDHFNREQGTSLMPDIKKQNFVYGRADQGPAHTYYVDAFPIMNNWLIRDFQGKVYDLIYAYSHLYNFPKAHQMLKEVAALGSGQ